MSSVQTRSLFDVAAEITAALQRVAFEIAGLQITPYMNANPSPPSIDVYPDDPFQTGAGFGETNEAGRWVPDSRIGFVIRARVGTADAEASQRLLYRMLDPRDPANVEAAIADTEAPVVPDGVSGFRPYVEDVGENGTLIGVEWRVATYL